MHATLTPRARAALLFPILLCASVCSQVAPPVPEQIAPQRPSLPPIESGPVSHAAEAAAAILLRDARNALSARDYELARSTARRVVREFPSAPGSSEVLQILAEAALVLDSPTEADSAASAFLTLLSPDHARRGELILLVGKARSAMGDLIGATEALLELPAGATGRIADESLELVRTHAPALPEGDIERLLASAHPDQPLRAPLVLELALAEYFRGNLEEAGRMAEGALSAGARGRDARMAQGLIQGDVESILGRPPILGALLPQGGSPTLQQYAELIAEGIEVAVATIRERSQQPVDLWVMDDRGYPAAGAAGVSNLESMGAMAIVGPLLDRSVETVASARTRGIPLVSPTVRSIPPDLDGVYSLSTVDPGAARILARYAWSDGLRSVVILHPDRPEHVEEASVFETEFRAQGGIVLSRIGYLPGSTSFEPFLREVEALLPDALVLPLPPEDIEILAPQVTFYGIDTLGVQILGTEGWTSEMVRAEVISRHTDGVVATTPQPPGVELPAYRLFLERYEALHRKTLRSRIPSLGYDAAALILEAAGRGARNPQDLRQALESIREYPGATGSLSVEDGRIVRVQHLVRFRGRELLQIPEDLYQQR